MPALTMRYRSILSNALDANTIRFATASSFGHRVSLPITIGDLTGIFMWTREVGESVPTATVDQDFLLEYYMVYDNLALY